MLKIKNIFLILIFFIILISTGCVNNSNYINEKEVLTIGFMKVDSIYPYSLNVFNRFHLFCNIFNGLIEFDENFNIIPALAESWNNPNELTWRFNLREGVKFHNGENLNSEDVKYSLNSSIYNYYKSFIKEVNIIDNLTIDIITFDIFPGLLQRLAHTFFVFSSNYDYEKESGIPIGTGPYRFVEYEENNVSERQKQSTDS